MILFGYFNKKPGIPKNKKNARTFFLEEVETFKIYTPRPGLEPGSKDPQSFRMSTTLPGHENVTVAY